MHLELMRVKEKEFPAISEPQKITSAKIWHCKFTTLSPISLLTNLISLEIATYPDESFNLLEPLQKLESLKITHLPHVSSLEPIAKLTNLKQLSLSTLPSWDASGKKTVVDSLVPIASLPNLVKLSLIGVVPESNSVNDLLNCKSLKHVVVSKYPKAEVEKLYEHYKA